MQPILDPNDILLLVVMGLFLLMMWFWGRIQHHSKPPKPTRAPAPCGNDKEHYFWEDQDFPCPVCFGKAERKRLDDIEERRARRLARYFAEEMKRNKS